MLPKFILLSFWAILGVPGTTAKFSRSTAKNTLTTPKFGRTTAGPRPDHAPTMISSCFFVLKWFGQTCSLNCRKAHIHFGSLAFGFEFYNKCYKFSI